MPLERIEDKIRALLALPHETEWVEFKSNHVEPEKIGQYISAISNSAGLHGKTAGYMVWGIEDESRHVIGTTFKPHETKVGNENIENWLSHMLSPRINFEILETVYQNKPLVIFEIQPCQHTPVSFKNEKFIRVGSYKKKLSDYPEKERALWRLLDSPRFESFTALKTITSDDVFSLLDCHGYFRMMGSALPEESAILERMSKDKLIHKSHGKFDITNLGAILFANRLEDFEKLGRKAVRVIVYRGFDRIDAIREKIGAKGYAIGFEGLVGYINDLLPQNEEIGQALRKEVKVYPEIAIRELVANAIIHQDLSSEGDSPLVEIFSDRIEITNPGRPLIKPERFLDEPPQSRNEKLAQLMRRLNICEERGSGIDKVIFSAEKYQLPAPEFLVTERHTKAILFAPKKLSDMDKKDKIRACYQHAALCFVSNKQMTNSSLRERFGIESRNSSIASRIINDTIEADLIKVFNPENKAHRYNKYIPFWA